MKLEFLKQMQCPYTGSRFDVTRLSGGDPSTIDYGVATSEAGAFPIVSGVLRLIADDLRGPIVSLVEQGRNEAALTAALEVPYLSRSKNIVNGLWRRARRFGNLGPLSASVGPNKRRLHDLVTQTGVSFTKLAAGAPAPSWTSWQTYRFSMPTFLAAHPLSHLAKGRKSILDFGCGLGHSSFLMRRLESDSTIVCADYSFTSMYLAKRFLVPDAHCICLDGDFPLPFDDGFFDCVFSTDALQYIESKVGLARDCARVLSKNGVIAFAHLHNRRSPIKAGNPLTARGYHQLFAGMARRLYPEEAIVSDYVEHGTLRLDRQLSLEALDRELGGLSLIAAHDESAIAVEERMWEVDMDVMRRPQLNPAYRAASSNGGLSLERHIGEPYAIERRIHDREVLPRTWRVEMKAIDSSAILALRDADRGLLRELVRRFIVLEVPENYV